MEACKHCGRACQTLYGILVLPRAGVPAWYAEQCCDECKAKYQRQNESERQRQQRPYARRR